MLYLASLLRTLVGWLDLAAFTALMLLLALLPRPVLNRIYPPLFHAWCRCFVRALGVQLNVLQQYRGGLPKHYVLIANHPSAFEDVGIPALFPVRSLAKEEVRDWWILGRIAIAANSLFVKRESPTSRQAALQAIVDAVAAGDNIAIYPEGGCKGRRVAPRFFGGAFIAAHRTATPILPVFLHYEAQADFEWGPNETLPQKIIGIARARNRRVNVYIFDPIDPARFADANVLRAYCHSQYQQWQQRFLE